MLSSPTTSETHTPILAKCRTPVQPMTRTALTLAESQTARRNGLERHMGDRPATVLLPIMAVVSPRDRSIVTVAALIARDQTLQPAGRQDHSAHFAARRRLRPFGEVAADRLRSLNAAPNLAAFVGHTSG